MSWLSTSELAQMRADVANLMPDTCSILAVSYTSDGEGGLTEAWGTAYADVPCRLDYRSGVERMAGGAIESYSKAVLSLPYTTTIDATNRVKIGSYTYAITSLNLGQSWDVVRRAEVEKV